MHEFDVAVSVAYATIDRYFLRDEEGEPFYLRQINEKNRSVRRRFSEAYFVHPRRLGGSYSGDAISIEKSCVDGRASSAATSSRIFGN